MYLNEVFNSDSEMHTNQDERHLAEEKKQQKM